MIMPEEKLCDIYFDPLLFVWAKVLAEEIYNESIDSKSMDVPESELWYQGEQPIVIEFLKRGQIKIWSNRAIKNEKKEEPCEECLFVIFPECRYCTHHTLRCMPRDLVCGKCVRSDAGALPSEYQQNEEAMKEQDVAEEKEWGSWEERMKEE